MAKYKVFTKENALKARHLIGKEVEYSDTDFYSNDKIKLINIKENQKFPFILSGGSCWKSIRVPVEEEFRPEIFHVANMREAGKFIDKEVEYYFNEEWCIAKLVAVRTTNFGEPFVLSSLSDSGTKIFSVALIRTTPNSYSKKADPKTTHKISKETLLKSVAQWDLMSRGIEKEKAYAAIAGQPTVHSCFLCDEVGQINGPTNLNLCKHCITWNDTDGVCFSENNPTPYTSWWRISSPENAKAVADFLFQKYQEMDDKK